MLICQGHGLLEKVLRCFLPTPCRSGPLLVPCSKKYLFHASVERGEAGKGSDRPRTTRGVLDVHSISQGQGCKRTSSYTKDRTHGYDSYIGPVRSVAPSQSLSASEDGEAHAPARAANAVAAPKSIRKEQNTAQQKQINLQRPRIRHLPPPIFCGFRLAFLHMWQFCEHIHPYAISLRKTPANHYSLIRDGQEVCVAVSHQRMIGKGGDHGEKNHYQEASPGSHAQVLVHERSRTVQKSTAIPPFFCSCATP